MDPSRCVRECGSEVIHALSLFRQRVNSRPTMTDDDGSRLSVSSGRTKISGFDPVLPTVRTTSPAEPLQPLFDPPIERAASGPGC
jgi:hypothetical protein